MVDEQINWHLLRKSLGGCLSWARRPCGGGFTVRKSEIVGGKYATDSGDYASY